VCITDSEGDIHELFAEPRGERPVHWLIHACQDQAVVGQPGQPLRDQVLNTPLLYEVQLRIRGRQSKTTAEDRNRRQNRVTRKANVERCTATLTLRPPWRPDRERPPVTVQVVLVREPTPPPGEPPVEWLLLTTLPIATAEQMRTNVAYYCLRWTIATDCPHYTSSERWCGQHAVGYDEPVRTEGEKGDWTECHDVNTVVSMTQGLDAGPRAACATAVPAAGDVGGPTVRHADAAGARSADAAALPPVPASTNAARR